MRIAAIAGDDPIPLAGRDQLYFQPRGLIQRYGYAAALSDWDLLPS